MKHPKDWTHDDLCWSWAKHAALKGADVSLANCKIDMPRFEPDGVALYGRQGGLWIGHAVEVKTTFAGISRAADLGQFKRYRENLPGFQLWLMVPSRLVKEHGAEDVLKQARALGWGLATERSESNQRGGGALDWPRVVPVIEPPASHVAQHIYADMLVRLAKAASRLVVSERVAKIRRLPEWNDVE